MPRIRTIKPEIWDSEKLGRLNLLARLTFIGLISLADDTGKGRGDPIFLRGRLHPYAKNLTDASFKGALGVLHQAKLVTFYESDGCRYYIVNGWSQHQKIEKPSKSSIPDSGFGEDSGNSRGGVGEESPLDQGSRKGSRIKDQGRDQGEVGTLTPAGVSPVLLKDLWNSNITNSGLAKATELSRDRIKKCRLRLEERPLEAWGEIFARVAKTPFLKGENDRGWRADFDWIIANSDNALKVMEGKYDGSANKTESRISGGAAYEPGKYDRLRPD